MGWPGKKTKARKDGWVNFFAAFFHFLMQLFLFLAAGVPSYFPLIGVMKRGVSRDIRSTWRLAAWEGLHSECQKKQSLLASRLHISFDTADEDEEQSFAAARRRGYCFFRHSPWLCV
ncbi:hypothetical protein IWX46DRAFT_73864 [Phyllosticta citricarpa]|uniref:Uncharacterized protein n=1 Tax=Phyllosticta citricarpa TaxID=55181 RepID=A0ABR1MDK8_9PEZI